MAPTLNGGLRIDVEEAHDWEVLRCVLMDAEPADLAAHLTGEVGPEAEDWEEYVQPDLLQTFEDQLALVRQAMSHALITAAGGPGELFIEKQDAEAWYGAFNQARLALHAHHDFSTEDPDPLLMDPARRSAFFRYQFYMVVQDLLLTHVMRK